jgi:chemotaxis protein histidine kinase CheA
MQRIVVKKFVRKALKNITEFKGLTILGNGKIVLILNSSGLLKYAR